jgi:hypothetical protein
VPAGWVAGLHWVVEAYECGMEQPPVGQCWVIDPSHNLPPDRQHEAFLPAHVETIVVRDDSRRAGVATALIYACRQKWPDLDLIDSKSDAGPALVSAYVR